MKKIEVQNLLRLSLQTNLSQGVIHLLNLKYSFFLVPILPIIVLGTNCTVNSPLMGFFFNQADGEAGKLLKQLLVLFVLSALLPHEKVEIIDREETYAEI